MRSIKIKLSTIFFILLHIPMAFAVKAPEILHLDRFSDFPLDSRGMPQKFFLLSNSVHDAVLKVRNNIGDFRVKLNCDGKESVVEFQSKRNKNLKFSKDVEYCVLIFSDTSAIRLIKDERVYPFLKPLHRNKESCNYQFNPNQLLGLDVLFLTNQYPMMTCAHEAPTIEILAQPEDGLLSKMEVLLGYKPSIDFIKNQNPYAKLDFSKAPQLDAIFVSTLLYRNDFTGAVLARLLRFHAQRGTLVNIIGTGYMHGDKDDTLLKELSQFRGNLRVQEFKFIEEKLSLKSLKILTNFLRDMHVKMFVTLSSKNPAANQIIMGGRNIHDGFVFSEKPDLSKYPELDQSPEGAYAFWNDLEIKITASDLARSVYSHLLGLWNRKLKGQAVTDIQEPLNAAKKINGAKILNNPQTMIRHFMSLPYNDDRALEKLFVEMIDQAQHTIRLSSPYLRPTKAIMAAFKRALSRGIKIIIQTRIDLKGDTAAWLYEETNKSAINALYNYDRIQIYEWTENSILHTKMIIVDDDFVFFGSVNLSRRSFIQDVESGFLIRNKKFVGNLIEIFNNYNTKSQLIEEKQKRNFLTSIIMLLFQNQF